MTNSFKSVIIKENNLEISMNIPTPLDTNYVAEIIYNVSSIGKEPSWSNWAKLEDPDILEIYKFKAEELILTNL
ncbi:MAG: hypothetical protein H8D97_01375 [Proteobacteria bacterium]|nr:hypothetical protein [Pseudomonadota bacterium]